MKPKTLILRTAGTNCDAEAAHAFELAGAESEMLHINRLLEQRDALDRYQILTIPGGFSYGDDIAAGRIFANQIRHHLSDAFRRFIDAGKPIIGICNGFQVLVKTDLLPGPLAGHTGQTATLAHNDCGRFVDRWVHLATQPSRCVWTQGIDRLDLPVAHGEGKFVTCDAMALAELHENRQVALTYTKADGSPARGTFPDNPNGSIDDIAGVCDTSGLVLGLMPHPERFVNSNQHPNSTGKGEGAGLQMFKNGVNFALQAVGSGV